MNDNQFWLGLWKVVAVALVLVVMSIGACSMRQTKLSYEAVTKAIERGVDPLDAACLFGRNDTMPCVLRATKGRD